MGSRFGYDFSNVKIHADETASRSSDSVDARAYTVGNDIVFGQGQYHPDTLDGRRLLAHELTHVIQQSKLMRYGIASSSYIKNDEVAGHLSQNYAEVFKKAYIPRPNSTSIQIAWSPGPTSGRGGLMLDANSLIDLDQTGGARANEYGIKKGTRVFTIESIRDEVKGRHNWEQLQKKYNIEVLPDPKISRSRVLSTTSSNGRMLKK